jgi:hypothetical protein
MGSMLVVSRQFKTITNLLRSISSKRLKETLNG